MTRWVTPLALCLAMVWGMSPCAAQQEEPVYWEYVGANTARVQLDDETATCFRRGVDVEARLAPDWIEPLSPGRGTYFWGDRRFTDWHERIVEHRADGVYVWEMTSEQVALLVGYTQRRLDEAAKGAPPSREAGPRDPRDPGVPLGGLTQASSRAGFRPQPYLTGWLKPVAVFLGKLESCQKEEERDRLSLRVIRVLRNGQPSVRIEAEQTIAFQAVHGSAGTPGEEKVWMLGFSDSTIIGFESFPAASAEELVRQLEARPELLLEYGVSGGIEGRMDHLIVFADGTVIDGYGGEVSCVTMLTPEEKAVLDDLLARHRAIQASSSDGPGVADGMGSMLVFAGKGEGDGGREVRSFGEKLLNRLATCREVWRIPNTPVESVPGGEEELRRILAEKERYIEKK